MNILVPAQVESTKAFNTVKKLVGAAQNSMLVTFFVPLGFTAFMAVSMHRVWGMYNFLQIESNFINIPIITGLKIPSNTHFTLTVLKEVSFFKLL